MGGITHVLCVVVAASTATLNEAMSMALQMRMKVASTQEIEATMTQESALHLVLGMNRTRSQPELMSLIQTHFAHTRQTGGDEADPVGYAAVDGATKMLNDMLTEARKNLDDEEVRCIEYDQSSREQMGVLRESVVYYNGVAAEARSRVLKSQSNIASWSLQLRKAQEDYAEHKKQCTASIAQYESHIVVVKHDISIVRGILTQTQCKVDGDATFLLQCSHCGGMILADQTMRSYVGQLQSEAAREVMARGLNQTFEDSMDAPLALTQERVDHIRRHIVKHGRHLRHRSSYTDVPGAINVSDVPTAPTAIDCVPDNKCTITGSANCKKLRDKFITVQGGIVDRKEQLELDLAAKQKWCSETSSSFESQIITLDVNIGQEQTNLATAIEDQNKGESGSHLKSSQHADATVEYTKEMKECCDNQNNYKSEECALKKIRGQLFKLKGTTVFITDCEVSEWEDEECSLTCGGGVKKRSRSIITHPIGFGVRCPPLTAQLSCNSHACPVDCVLDDWAAWSGCSAQCDGGVRERSRAMLTEAQYGGDPCGVMELTETCGADACDVPCELGDWSAWSTCSKACDGGWQSHEKLVKVPSKGTGHCPAAHSPERFQYIKCNTFACSIPTGRDTVKCNSKVDVILLVDGSGSLQQSGWDKSVAVATTIINNLATDDNKVLASVLLFSGPNTQDAYDICTGSKQVSYEVDVEQLCGLKWISHFTSALDGLSTTVSEMTWPASTTYTSGALGLAENELVNGREDANSVVIVLTDGWPISPMQTEAAAGTLNAKAKVVWVPVGNAAPRHMIEKLAAQPIEDHIVSVASFSDLGTPTVLNKIITATCPVVA